jgi:biopolymer transport protein ExbD
MQLKPQPVSQHTENILPLVNVVFLLLIFFMLAGSFSKPDVFKVAVPTAENENTADRNELTIFMNANGEIALDKTIISDEELQKIVADKVKSDVLTQIQLKADANVSATRLIDVMEVLGKTELNSLRLLTVHPDAT